MPDSAARHRAPRPRGASTLTVAARHRAPRPRGASTLTVAARHRAPRPRGASTLTVAAVAFALAAGAGTASAAVARPEAVSIRVEGLQATLEDAIAVAPLQDPVPLAAAAPASGAVPARLLIPDIGVDSALPPLTLDAQGALLPPERLDTAGWYTGSAVPGRTGPAVLAGHVDDTSRAGVFARLHELRPGARIDVLLSDGTAIAYRMARALDIAKSDFPTAEVYGPTPGSQLRLVTCSGPYDFAAGHYRNNLVVFAVPLL